MKTNAIGLVLVGLLGLVTACGEKDVREADPNLEPTDSGDARANGGAGGEATTSGGAPNPDLDAGMEEPPEPVDAVTPAVSCPVTVGSGSDPLIDDFEDGDLSILPSEGRQGPHFTYSDGVVDLSVVEGGANGSSRAARFAGSGLVMFGTGWEMGLNYTETPNFDVIECPFDPSNYVGVAFWARTELASATIELALGVAANERCYEIDPPYDCQDYYSNVSVELGPEWQRHELLWTDFPFFFAGLQPSSDDPATIRYLYELTFKPISNVTGFAFLVDDIEFITGDCGSGVCDPTRPCPSDCCGDSVCTASEVNSSIPSSGGGRSGSGLLFCPSDCPADPTECPRAEIITVPQTTIGNSALASDDFTGSCLPPDPLVVVAPDAGLPPPDTTPAPDVEYLFTAPEDAIYVFTATSADFTPLVYVLDDSCGGSELSCGNVLNVFGQATVSVPLIAGQTVTVVVDGLFGGRGPFTLDVDQLSGACPDEDLGTAIPINVSGTTAAEENTVFTGCGDVTSPDYTYLWTAPADGFYRFDLAGSTYDTVLTLRDGDCSGLEIACDDNGDFTTLQSRLSVNVAAGQTLAVTVDGFGASGDYALTIEDLECPAGALDSVLPVVETGSTVGLPDTLSSPCGGFGAPDTALTWTAPTAGTYVFDTFGSTFDTTLSLLDGANCGGAVLTCNDDALIDTTLSLQSQVTAILAEGQTVVVVVDGFGAVSGDFTLNITAP